MSGVRDGGEWGGGLCGGLNGSGFFFVGGKDGVGEGDEGVGGRHGGFGVAPLGGQGGKAGQVTEGVAVAQVGQVAVLSE